MMALKILSLTTTLFVSSVVALTNVTMIDFCAFNIKLAPSDDPTSLDFTYTPTTSPILPEQAKGKACQVEVYFQRDTVYGDVFLEEIEYTSSKSMSIESKLAISGVFAPILYDQVTTTGNGAVVARNISSHTTPRCQSGHENRGAMFWLQTKVGDVDIGPDFKLEQKIRLRFGEGKICTPIVDCDLLDIDGKLPPCHGSKYPYNDPEGW